jgi:hypothetical protein
LVGQWNLSTNGVEDWVSGDGWGPVFVHFEFKDFEVNGIVMRIMDVSINVDTIVGKLASWSQEWEEITSEANWFL